MADTLVEITAGSGTNVDTRTEGTNGHHRQVMVIGDPSTNAGVAPVSVTAGLKVDLGADNDVTHTLKTSGGYDIFRSIDLDESEEEVKSTAGQVFGYYFYNAAATAIFLKFYNAAIGDVTVGTTIPVLTLGLPTVAAGHIDFGAGVAFSTGITVAATTGVADNDTGAPGANEVIINVFYK